MTPSREHFEDMVTRRMENTGESRVVAEEHVQTVLQKLSSGQWQTVDLPDGSAVIFELEN